MQSTPTFCTSTGFRAYEQRKLLVADTLPCQLDDNRSYADASLCALCAEGMAPVHCIDRSGALFFVLCVSPRSRGIGMCMTYRYPA